MPFRRDLDRNAAFVRFSEGVFPSAPTGSVLERDNARGGLVAGTGASCTVRSLRRVTILLMSSMNLDEM